MKFRINPIKAILATAASQSMTNVLARSAAVLLASLDKKSEVEVVIRKEQNEVPK